VVQANDLLFFMIKNVSIKNALVILILSVSVLPLLVLSIFLAPSIYEEQLRTSIRNGEIYNHTIQRQIENETKRLISKMGSKSESFAKWLEKDKSQDEAVSILQQFGEWEPVIKAAALFDANENIIIGLNKVEGEFRNYTAPTDRLAFINLLNINSQNIKRAIETSLKGKLFIGEPIINSDRPMFVISVPIEIKTQQFVAFLAYIDIENMWKNLVDTQDSNQFTSYLLSHDGRIISSNLNDQSLKNQSFLTLDIVSEWFKYGSWNNLTSYQNYEGTDVYGVIDTIPMVGWFIMSEVNKVSIEQPISNSLVTSLIFSAAIVGLCIIVAYYIANLLLKPITQLTTAINHFSDGETFDINYRSPIAEIQKLIACFHDMVRARSNSENNLKLSKQKLQLHRDQSPLAVIECDIDFNITDWNAAAEHIFGYDREEVIGSSARDKLFPPDVMLQEAKWQQLLLNENIENVTKSGNRIVCDWHNTPLVDSEGGIVGITSTVEDITYRLQSEKILRNSDEEKQLILDNMVVAVITIDQQGIIKNMNKMVSIIFGYSWDELIGSNISKLMPASIAEKHSNYLSQYDETGKRNVVGFAREVEGQRKGGEIFPMRLSVAEFPKDNDGKRIFIGSCIDLTEDKIKDELLRRSQKMDAIGTLTGGIAHDYNNMLGVILGYAELLKTKLADNEKLLKFAVEIYKAGERSRLITEKLLAFSRPTDSKTKVTNLNHQLLKQRELIERTLTSVIEVKYELCDESWNTEINTSDFDDAILNMAINAKHAMPKGGILAITTEVKTLNKNDAELAKLTEGEYLVVSLKDTGMGMNKETQHRIFDPFYSTKGDLGTGLGLSQVFGFVNRSKGSINVVSQKNKGTTFTLYFPRSIVEESEKTKNEEILISEINNTGVILVVEDERAMANLAHHILESTGYQVHQVSGGEEALKFLSQQNVDLIISDVVMPKMNGYQFAENVHTLFPKQKMILASGFCDDIESSNDEFISELRKNIIRKPYSKEDLLNAVKKNMRDVA